MNLREERPPSSSLVVRVSTETTPLQCPGVADIDHAFEDARPGAEQQQGATFPSEPL